MTTEFQEAFAELESDDSRPAQDYFMMFIVNSATCVVMKCALDRPKDIDAVDKSVRADFRRAISYALQSRASPYYRFFKKIEAKCRPLCFAKFADLTSILVKDVMQNAGVEEVLALSAEDVKADYQTYFALVKTVATDFIKYFFMINLPDVVCSQDCKGPSIDDMFNNYIK